MKEKIRLGYIGLGRRGYTLLVHCLAKMPDVEITMVSDFSEEKLKRAAKIIEDNGGKTPIMTKDYKDIINSPDIDAVAIMTGWSGRAQMAEEAMLAGKYTAVEVGCADTVEECFRLIDVYEQTKTPLMMLENCCYDRLELAALNMVKQGLFGELVHCTGGYAHYLNSNGAFLKSKLEEIPHYRIGEYISRNRENYPTHALGPISKILSINRGNRFVSLNSISSKACALKAYAKENLGEDSEFAKLDYKQGDIVNTIITCAGGETVLLTLDTTMPRAYYSRHFSVRGTKGMCDEERKVIYLEGMNDETENNKDEMLEKYDHPIQKAAQLDLHKDAHGGMDWLVCRAFIESVKNGTNTPIDAYDTVTWMAVGALSEESIKNGGAPVAFPDFTRGKWQSREPVEKGKYCLDEIVEDI